MDSAQGKPSIVADAVRQARACVLLVRTTANITAQAAPSVPCFLVHSDARGLRSMFDGYCLSGASDGVLCFHGTPERFIREIPISPDVIILDSAASLLALWPEIPVGAWILIADDAPGVDKWVHSGFLERTLAPGVYRASRRFTQGPACPPRRIVSEVHARLQRHYAQGSDADTLGLTEPVRQWRLEQQSGLRRGGWPARQPNLPALPDCLPDGSSWPLISVVTPSFNQGKYIEETILSVANQRYPRIEHIVMDGGSTDQTAAVLDRHRWRLAAAVSEKDRGQSHAINKGMALANGEILTWLNSDDMLAPDALAGVAFGFWMSKADMVAGVVRLQSAGETTGFHLTSCAGGPLPLDDLLDLDGGWNAGKFFYQPEVMFTRNVWERAGGRVREDLYYSMDYDLWVRMAQAKAKLHVIGREVAWFRLHEEQKTNVEERFKTELRQYIDDYVATSGLPLRPTRARTNPRHRLRVALLNDHGFQYGAGIAHRRLGETLQLAGHHVEAAKLTEDSPAVNVEASLDLTGEEIANSLAASNPDLVVIGNVHSAGASALQLQAVAERFPTLALVHDFWWVTGRCAYPMECSKYLSGCDHSCPTQDQYPRLAPVKIAPAWESKRRVLSTPNGVTLVANSSWTQEYIDQALGAAGSKTVTGRMRLPFPLETFVPADRQGARVVLDLPKDRFLVLVTGDLYDPRKNTGLVLEALRELNLPDVTVVSLGHKEDGEDFGGLDVIRPGHIKDPRRMALYYSAADVFAGPSKAETFGQVFIESIACGTPAIAFEYSGMTDALLDNVTGLFAGKLTASEIAAAILSLYRQPERRAMMAGWGRLFVENEWSAHASYYSFHRMLEDTGLADRLNMPPKIGFAVNPPKLDDARLVSNTAAVQVNARGVGREEGPYPDLNLPVFRWAYGPSSVFEIAAAHGGVHSVVIRYRTVFEGQRIDVRVNGAPTGSYSLKYTGISEDHMVCFGAPLRPGTNEIEIGYKRWLQPNEGDRPLAMAVTDIWAARDASA